jgi:thiamine transport system substrate-binding protein
MKDPSFQIDLLYGVDNTMLVEFKESGLFHAYLPENSDLLLSEIRLDQDHFFTPINYGWLGFEYSLDGWDKGFPSYLTDLVREPWRHQYILTNPRTSDVGLLFALWLDAAGFDVEKELPLLKENAFILAPNWGSAYTLYVSGEAPFVLTYGTSPAYHAYVEGDEDQRTTLDKENSYVHIEFMGIAKNSHDTELSQRFLDYMLSDKVQSTLPRKVWVLPSRTDISLPEEFEGITRPEKLLSHTPERIKELKEIWFASRWF